MGSLIQIQLNYANVIVTGDPGTTTPDVLDRWESVDHGFDYQAAVGVWTADPQRLPIVGLLRGLYSALAWILVAPALLGLIWGTWAGGRNRLARSFGLAAVSGVLVHAAVLGVYYAGADPLGTGSPYTISSESFLTVGLCLGTWLSARLARSCFGRRAIDAETQESKSAPDGDQRTSVPLVS